MTTRLFSAGASLLLAAGALTGLAGPAQADTVIKRTIIAGLSLKHCQGSIEDVNEETNRINGRYMTVTRSCYKLATPENWQGQRVTHKAEVAIWRTNIPR
ncbi:hypothetical protein [Microbacterium sp. A93]|uniref:hypothetical protein n=1 Tax=Microbacterium sp. A93 TaxID=3450716 RepID=UPI003F43D91B